MGWIGKAFRVGRVAEPAGPAPQPATNLVAAVRGSLQDPARRRRLLQRERGGEPGRVRAGVRRRAVRRPAGGSPRHADAALVTGVVTRNMADPLRDTVDATPRPRRVIACGDCALNGGVSGDGDGVVGAVGEVVAVDVGIPGCPPTPSRIVEALRSVTGK